MAPENREEAMRKCRLGTKVFVDHIKQRGVKQFDLDIMEKAQVVDASMDGRVVIEIELDMRYANGGGTLHGAGAAAIFDCYTSTAFNPLLPDWSVQLHSTGPPGGVTRALNVAYLRPVKLPGRVRVEAEVVSNGRTATFARGTMTSLDGEKVYATCDHHKIPTQSVKGWTKPESKPQSKL